MRSARGDGDHRRTWTFQTQTVAFSQGRHEIPRSPPLCLSAVFICIIPATPGLITLLWFACLLLKFRPGIRAVQRGCRDLQKEVRMWNILTINLPRARAILLPSSSPAPAPADRRRTWGRGDLASSAAPGKKQSSFWLKPSLDAGGRLAVFASTVPPSGTTSTESERCLLQIWERQINVCKDQ